MLISLFTIQHAGIIFTALLETQPYDPQLLFRGHKKIGAPVYPRKYRLSQKKFIPAGDHLTKQDK